MRRARWQTFSFALAIALGLGRCAVADCAPFYDSLNDLASISANGGTVTGSVTFAPAVNGNGAFWGAASHVTYSARGFRTPSGTLALWFRKTSAADAGGICQIGTLSEPSSIGLFYTGASDLCFEMRSSTGEFTQLCVTGVLSPTQWTHLAATWREEGSVCHLWLFVNGAYRGYAQLSGTLSHADTTLQVGVTGYYGHGRGGADELRWFDWDLLDSEVFAEYVYSSNRYCRQPAAKPVSTGPVQVIGKCLYVDGRPFRVNGVGYAPTPIGAWPGYPIYTDPGILARDVPLLRAMNVNTVRTWAQPPDDALLNALYNGGDAPIYVIVGFWIPTSGIDYGDPSTIAYYAGLFTSLVAQFKNHPGLLGWGIGNEVNLGLSGAALANWYAFANRLAEVAYEEEGSAYHPAIVVNAGLLGLGDVDYLSDDVSLNFVDLWGQNTYFGWDAHCYFDYYNRLSAKPLVFTEYGIDAWDNQSGTEYPSVQAAWDVHQWRQIRSACVGGTVMAYSDEWWKADNPYSHDYGGYATKNHPDGFSNEEWWGLVAVQDNGAAPDIAQPRPVYAALAQEYAYTAGDFDRDGDVDLLDYAAAQTCCGSAVNGACGIVFDLVVDDAIDFADFVVFARLFSGPDQPRACGEGE